LDAGRRRLTLMRIVRPFVLTVVIVPFVMPGFDLHGQGLLLEIAGIVAGALLGLLASALMRTEYDSASRVPMTVAGLPYLLLWVVVAAARTLFTYEAESSLSFQRALGEFLVSHHISSVALGDAVMFLGFAMLIAQRGTLYIRSRRLTTGAAVSARA
jgi:membrane protein CcdC involved in cytochrome C biogenesis